MRRYIDVPTLLAGFLRRGYNIPEGTVRRWAARAHRCRLADGQTVYLVSDLLPLINAWVEREDQRRSQMREAA